MLKILNLNKETHNYKPMIKETQHSKPKQGILNLNKETNNYKPINIKLKMINF